MRTLLIFFCFLYSEAYSQTKLDFGEVSGQSFSSCKLNTDGVICKSVHELEISLTSAWVLAGKYEMVTLIYNDFEWQAFKYEGDWINDTVLKFPLKPNKSFDKIFTGLKENNVFLLPDQSKLRYHGEVADGTDYSLSFKAGDKFRKYEFQNPDIYLSQNKQTKEFTNYVSIVKILFEELSKE